MATRVSCGFADITISLDMYTPNCASDRGGAHERSTRAAGVAQGCALGVPRGAVLERPIAYANRFPHPMRSSIQNWNSNFRSRWSGTGHCMNLFLFLFPASASGAQLTNRRIRTFITSPKAKNTKAVAEPP